MPTADSNADRLSLEGMAAAFAADESVRATSARQGIHEIAFRLHVLEGEHRKLQAHARDLENAARLMGQEQSSVSDRR